MKHRLQRVNELLKRELSEIISRDLTFDTLVTVQQVDVTPDLKNAHVFVSAIGSDQTKAVAITKIEQHRTGLQHTLSKRVVLKYTPHLHFHLDDSVERGVRVIELMEKIEIPADEVDDDQ